MSNQEWQDSSKFIKKEEQKQIFHEKREALLPVKYSTGRIAKSLEWYEKNNNIFLIK